MESVRLPVLQKLFEKFVKGKLDQYVKPTRKETPRGEPIGFSKVKYHASWLAITSLTLKDIGKKLKVSHQIVRRWNTEKAFQQKVTENRLEFSRHFVQAHRMMFNINKVFKDFLRDKVDPKVIIEFAKRKGHLGKGIFQDPDIVQAFSEGKLVQMDIHYGNEAKLYGEDLKQSILQVSSEDVDVAKRSDDKSKFVEEASREVDLIYELQTVSTLSIRPFSIKAGLQLTIEWMSHSVAVDEFKLSALEEMLSKDHLQDSEKNYINFHLQMHILQKKNLVKQLTVLADLKK
jgi:hypothetical protein